MAYELINWKDFPNEETPLSSFNLNHMDTQIKKNADAVDVLKPFKTEAEKKFSQIDKELANSKVIEADGTNFELTTSEGGVLIKHMKGASSQDGTPTPDNPIEIKSADVNITSRTANMIPFPYYSNSPTTSRGVTFSYDANGVVIGKGTAESNQPLISLTNTNYEIKDNEYYALINDGDAINGFAIIYFYEKGTTTLKNVDIEVTYEDGVARYYTQNYLSLYFGAAIRKYCKFKVTTSSSEFSCFVQARYKGNVVVDNEIIKPMLVEVAEDGTYPTKYAPPFSTTADTSITLRAIGDVKDELQFVNDKFQIVRRIGYVDLGDYTYAYSPTNGTGDTTISGAKIQPIIGEAGKDSKCNKYLYNNVTIATMQDGDYRLHTANTSRYVFKNSNYTSASAYKAGMKGTMFQYVLETPTIEEISNEDAIKLLGLKSWEDTTYLIQNNECNGAITLMYGTTPEIATSLRAKNIALSNERKIDDLTSALLETTSLME